MATKRGRGRPNTGDAALTSRVTVYLSETDLQRLEDYSWQNRTRMAAVVRDLVEKFLQGQPAA